MSVIDILSETAKATVTKLRVIVVQGMTYTSILKFVISIKGQGHNDWWDYDTLGHFRLWTHVVYTRTTKIKIKWN